MSPPMFSATSTAEEVATALSSEIQGKNGELKLAAAKIKEAVPSANLRPLMLDLSSLAAVRKAAAEVLAYPEPLHVLIHNAAAPLVPFTLTVDNFEMQMATDHIAPFLLTKLLTPKLLASRTTLYTPRAVFVASIGHSQGLGVDFGVLAHPDPAYCQAKSANVLCAIELSKRSKGKINAYSLHPGAIFTNIMQKGEGVAAMQGLGVLDADGKPNKTAKFKTIPQGAATTVVAAFDPSLNETPGAYLNDCVVANELVAAHSSDPANAEKLWTLTEEIIGEPFGF
ncbi:NAD-P-binding protein [Mycena vitilis]|nr:NAD-P-binding protein [Mycena vitilis]